MKEANMTLAGYSLELFFKIQEDAGKVAAVVVVAVVLTTVD